MKSCCQTHFRKNVLINGICRIGTIDPGVQHCLIKASAAIRSSLRVDSSASPLYGVGNIDTLSTHTLGKVHV